MIYNLVKRIKDSTKIVTVFHNYSFGKIAKTYGGYGFLNRLKKVIKKVIKKL